MNEPPHENFEKDSEHPADPSPHEEEITLNIDKADKHPQFLYSPRVAGAGRGGAWFSEGWQLFMRAPVLFAIMGILANLLFWGANLVPLVGALVTGFFTPHIAAGFYLAYQHAHNDQPVNVGDLFQPFKDMQGLLALGGLSLAGSAVMTIVTRIFTPGGLVSPEMLEAYSSGETNSATPDISMFVVLFLLGLLIVLALSVMLTMAFLFSPILVHQHRLPALEAIQQSFNACWYNFMSFLIWGLIWLGVFLGISLLTIGLLSILPILGALLAIICGVAALLLLLPLTTGNIYLAYRDIFLR